MVKNIKEYKRKQIKRIIKKSIMLILIFITVTIMGTILHGYSLLSKINTYDFNVLGIKAENNEPINILITGMDIGDTQNLNNEGARRTDTIMLMNYNPLNKKTSVISIPRDTMIDVEHAYDENGNEQRYWKINSAYALGGEDEVISHVETLLDIEVNYMVEVDYEGFRNLIDAIGGVEMYIEQDMFYDDDSQNLHIKFNKGEIVNLDGKKAEEFFRWRQNNDGTGFENGDLDRIENQQKLISKVIEKCIDPSIVFKLPKIFNVITSSIKTNMPANEIVSFGKSIVKLNTEDFVMTSLKGYFEEVEGQSFIISDKDANKDLIESLKTSSIYTENISKENIKIMILNGTNKNGLAKKLKTNLYDLGYGTINTGNTDLVKKSVIQLDSNEIEEILKDDTGIKRTEKIVSNNYNEYDVVIIIGEDKEEDIKEKEYIRG